MVVMKSSGPEPPLKVKFISAGLAGCIGDLVTFPLDLAKVRLQVQGEGGSSLTKAARQSFKYKGIFGTILTVAREEGPRALYNGLVPGLQRQVAFCSVRIGLYDTVRGFYFGKFSSEKSGGFLTLLLRIAAGVTTGGMAVVCAQPTDVVKVRMQAQSSGPKRYHGSLHAYRTIAKHEGVRGLWKGALPNITRNAIVNAAELVSYDLIKTKILAMNLLSDNMPCHFVSAFGAGFITTVVASPVDVVKTRFMNSPPTKYSGALDCAVRMFREGGVVAFYKGFMPSFMRLGSWNIVMFVSFEQLKRHLLTLKAFKDAETPVALPSVG